MLSVLYIYIYIYIMSCMDFSDSLSLSVSVSLPLKPFLSIVQQGCCKYFLAGLPALAHLCGEVHRRKLLKSSSKLFQECPAFLGGLIWMFSEIGGWGPHSTSFVGFCFLDLFSIAHSVLVQLLSSFFSIRFVSVHVVHPYSSMDMTAGKKLSFVLLDRSDVKLSMPSLVLHLCHFPQIKRYFRGR